MSCTYQNHSYLVSHTSISVTLAPYTPLSYIHATQTTVYTSQSPQPPHQHMVPRQHHKQTKNDHMTTNTTQAHIPSSNRERSLIILQVNINGIKIKLEELKLLIHNTHADIITIQETKLTPKANTPKIHNFTIVHTDMLHKAGDGLITVIRDNITFPTTDIPSTINTHTTVLQMGKVHINNKNTSLLKTLIYLIETAHPHTTKQLTRTHNTSESTSQTYQTESSPEI